MNLFNKIFSYEHDIRPFPEGFVHHRQSPEYLAGECADKMRAQIVGVPECLGIRWHVGWLTMESYTTDVEPVITADNPSNIIIWEPIRSKARPKKKGWCEPWIRMNTARTGFATITEPAHYDADWSEHVRRHLKKWRKQPTHTIQEVSIDQFIDAYNTTGKLKFLRGDFYDILRRRKIRHGDHMHLYGAIDSTTGTLDAGLAVLDVDDIRTSNHIVAFFHDRVRKTPVNVGLIDHWYQESITRNMRFLNYGVFWVPGEPPSWKGFSRFKSQFDIQYIDSPTTYMMFRRPKKTT